MFDISKAAAEGLQAVERLARKIATEIFDATASILDKCMTMMHREELKCVGPHDMRLTCV